MTSKIATVKLPTATNLALDLPDNLTFEDWSQIGQELASRQRVLNWWIGDWWAAGQHRYGERAEIAAQGIFGKEYQTLRNIASVARSIETSRRRDNLSWSHHVEVAALPPEEADKMLDKASEKNLSVRELRRDTMLKKVHLGINRPRDTSDPDLEYDGFVDIARRWNRYQEPSRMLILLSLQEMGAIQIMDQARLGDIKV